MIRLLPEASPGGGQAPLPATPEASRPRTSESLGYSTFPSGSLSRSSGQGLPPAPKWCRGPLGWTPQGKPVRAFLHPANAGQVRAPHGVRGPSRSRSPSYSPGLPLSRAGFSPPPQGVQAPLRQRVLPTAHPSPFVPAATGPGSRPRGSPVRPRYLPLAAFATPWPLAWPFPPTRFRSSGYSRHGQDFTDPRRAARSREGFAPSPLQA